MNRSDSAPSVYQIQFKIETPFQKGTTAALFAQLVVYPIDMARRRMQNAQLVKTQNNLKDRFSVFETLRDLWRRSPSKFNKLSLIYR